MIPPAPALSSASSQHNGEPVDIPDPPEEASRYALDVLAQQASFVRAAPDGEQEKTLNNAAYRMGHLVGAGVISVEDARQGLEAAGADMVAHDARRPWAPGYIRYKVVRAIHQGVQSPAPIQQLIQRGAKQGHQPAVVVPPTPGDHPPVSAPGNAERGIARWADDVRHVPELAPTTRLGQWMLWSGRYWQPDLALRVQELAKETVRSIALETPQMEKKTDKEGKKVDGKNLTAEWASKSETAGRIKAMTELAISDGAIEARGSEFDQRPYLLNVVNGTIDLETHPLRPAERSDYLTQCAPVAYDPEATCPTWDQFLFQCMDGKQHLVEWHQTWAGYSLTGDVSEQKLIIHFGEGANGKSTYLEVLQQLMGSYAQAASPAAFMQPDRERGDTPNPALFALRGARAVQALETNERQELNMAMVKAVTGGDKISVRNLHCAPIEYRPQFKLALATNQLPRIEDRDYGAWRRLLASRWPVTFGQSDAPKIDPHLRDKLLLELPGILNWALAGCARWLESGLQLPAEVTVDTAIYKEESDDLLLFIEECLVMDADEGIAQSDMYDVYLAWDTSSRPLGKRRFNNKLARPGVTRHKSMGNRSWRGCKFSAVGQEIYERIRMQRF